MHAFGIEDYVRYRNDIIVVACRSIPLLRGWLNTLRAKASPYVIKHYILEIASSLKIS